VNSLFILFIVELIVFCIVDYVSLGKSFVLEISMNVSRGTLQAEHFVKKLFFMYAL